MKQYLKNSFLLRHNCYKSLTDKDEFINSVNEAFHVIRDALKKDSKIMICGNGGSASDSQHIAAEFVVKLKKCRAPMAAVSLTSDNSILTAIANDFSYDDIFARQVAAIGQKGDVLIGLTTSGKSLNIMKAFETAKTLGINTIVFTGKNNTMISKFTDIQICFNIDNKQMIQELYLSCMHLICEELEVLYEESSVSYKDIT